ncbi:hypothetical protein [Nonomuraea insulae]|uniref:Uncharacterized protein n=1 Tax=Nonomuraea insulae TaxID=1616787 RepID=A0ABW1CMI8_9ACTN
MTAGKLDRTLTCVACETVENAPSDEAEWKRWLTVAGSGHFTFIGLPILGGQAGITDPTAPLSGEIITSYVGAFFDQHLHGEHRPLLDGPSPANPEVAFQNP